MSKNKKKYIIFSPINEYGGIGLEVSYLAKIISIQNELKVISLGDFYKNSSVYLYDKDLEYNSLNRLVYQKDALIKWLTNLVCILKPIKTPFHFRVSNYLTRMSIVNITKRKKNVIENEIINCDVVVLCSQLTSNLMEAIVTISYRYNKKIVFRTTGQITDNQFNARNRDWFIKVSLFIHHSQRNLKKLCDFINTDTNIIIDQSALLEDEFLAIPPKNRKIRKFFTLSRLHTIKQINVVIEAFMEVYEENDQLTIYGSGEEEKNLKEMAKNCPNIAFGGKIDFGDVPKLFNTNDCLIISSSIEAGPYTGIESMASGTPIISTNVGSMNTRLPGYHFFYDGSKVELANLLQKIKGLDNTEIQKLSIYLKNQYLNKYSEAKITNQYLNAMNNL